MKILILTGVFAFGILSFSATAQETTPMHKDSTEHVVASTETMRSMPAYKKIDKSQLPQAIKDAVMNDLDGMMVSEAYIGADNTYKVVVTSMDKKETKTLLATQEGKWIKPDQKPDN